MNYSQDSWCGCLSTEGPSFHPVKANCAELWGIISSQTVTYPLSNNNDRTPGMIWETQPLFSSFFSPFHLFLFFFLQSRNSLWKKMTWDKKAVSSKRETRGKCFSVTQSDSRGHWIIRDGASKLLVLLGGRTEREGNGADEEEGRDPIAKKETPSSLSVW